MSLEITYVQNFLVKDSNLLKLLLVVFGFGSQTFICGFNRQNICSVGDLFSVRKLDLRTLFQGHLGPQRPWSEHFNFKPSMAQAPKDRAKKNKRGFKLLIWFRDTLRHILQPLLSQSSRTKIHFDSISSGKATSLLSHKF